MDNKENKDMAAGQIPQKPNSAPINNKDEDIDEVPLYKKKKVIIPLFIFLVGMVVIGYYWYTNMQDFVSTDDAFIDADKISVSGKILGRINYLGTQEGDTVKAGQVLIKIDDTDLRAQQTSVNASISLSEESVKLSEVQLQRAQEDFDRADSQYKGGAITKEQYDHAKKSLEAAKATCNIDMSKITAAKSQLGVIQTQLANTIIASPMDGIVAKRWVLSGEIIQPGQPVFTVYDVKDLWVTANMEETKVGKLHIGSPVEIKVDSYPELTFHGKIFEIGMYTASEFSLIPPNNASGNFTKVTQRVPVKITIENDSKDKNQPVLRPGMSVEVSVKVR